LITSWDDEEDKANAKYDAIRGKSKQNAGSSNKNNRDQAVATKPTRVLTARQVRHHSRGYLAPCERQLEEDL
jgi:hypothetical protein